MEIKTLEVPDGWHARMQISSDNYRRIAACIAAATTFQIFSLRSPDSPTGVVVARQMQQRCLEFWDFYQSLPTDWRIHVINQLPQAVFNALQTARDEGITCPTSTASATSP